jgi:CYTH domain-containing protein
MELLDNFFSSDISKRRYEVKIGEKIWEVDEFLGKNEGLLVAEIELSSESEYFDLPEWVRQEVTGQEKYYNSNVSTNPFTSWM